MKELIAFPKVIYLPIMTQKNAMRQKKIAFRIIIKYLIMNAIYNVQEILKIKIMIIYASAHTIIIIIVIY